MLIGILSDTHDQAAAAAAGVATLRAAGAEFFIHCGDVGGEQILDLFAGLRLAFVWGNCDYDRAGLERYATEIGVDCRGDFADLEIDGKKIAVTHGDNAALVARAIEPGRYDYFLTGHSHIPSDRKTGNLRIINPGALYRAATKTVAVLDPVKNLLRHLTVRIG